jgi:hypothetical protein
MPFVVKINLINSLRCLTFVQHITLSFGILSCTILTTYWVNTRQLSGLVQAKAELRSVQSELKTSSVMDKLRGVNATGDTNPKKSFTELLSSNTKSDEVVREMSRLAAGKVIWLESLKITSNAATSSELGKVQYNVAMKTDYFLFKGWLSGLLSRYPALGVNTLSIRGSATDTTKQEINLSLLLYIKD